MEKTDFRRDRADLYGPGRDFSVVDVPAFDFLMVDGHGNPNSSPDYVAALEALYALSYRAKFASKIELGRDYTVLPLEGLWYAESIEAFYTGAKDDWSWTMMIRQPVPLPPELWQSVRSEAAKKKLPALPGVRLESFAEGPSVQVMYVGAYADEGPTIHEMHEWIAKNGYSERGHHHEIYLGDPRQSVSEKLKTVLRQPIRPA
ncbi:MAG: GyrI-like domain-containing protein [Pseudolysinimonas sp.]